MPLTRLKLVGVFSVRHVIHKLLKSLSDWIIIFSSCHYTGVQRSRPFPERCVSTHHFQVRVDVLRKQRGIFMPSKIMAAIIISQTADYVYFDAN